MSTLHIKDFRYGLDARRGELSLRPGTLVVGKNVFINQGGEIENRKAFVRTNLPEGTMGLVATATGLVTFGSIAPPDMSGTGVTYQRLQHPAVLAGTSEDPNLHAMFRLVAAVCFGAYAFAIAEFADGHRYCYYNGVLVRDFTDGLIMEYMDNISKVAEEIEGVIDRTNKYTADHPGSSIDERVDMTGEYGTDFTVTAAETSASGTISVTFLAEPVAAVDGIPNSWSFRVIRGSAAAGTNKVTDVKINAVDSISADVNWAISNQTTTQNITNEINSHISSPDYSASKLGDQVNIVAADQGTTPNSFPLAITAAGDVCVGWFKMTVSGSPTDVTNITAGGVEILGATVTFSTTLAAFASAVAAQIRTFATNYTAFASGASVYISKKITASTDAATEVIVTYNGGTWTFDSVSDPVDTLTGSAAPSTLTRSLSKLPGTYTIGTLSPSVTTAAGGVGPYTYSWERFDPVTGMWAQSVPASGKVQAINPTTASTYFAAIITLGRGDDYISFTNLFRCKVTDSDTPANVAYTNTIQVTLTVVNSD